MFVFHRHKPGQSDGNYTMVYSVRMVPLKLHTTYRFFCRKKNPLSLLNMAPGTVGVNTLKDLDCQEMSKSVLYLWPLSTLHSRPSISRICSFSCFRSRLGLAVSAKVSLHVTSFMLSVKRERIHEIECTLPTVVRYNGYWEKMSPKFSRQVEIMFYCKSAFLPVL